MTGKAYSFGDNTSQKLGISGPNLNIAMQVLEVQDKEGNTIELHKMENIETGRTHSEMSDENGFVYSVGLNATGQLGTEDNNSRTKFTKIGQEEIITNSKTINIPVR